MNACDIKCLIFIFPITLLMGCWSEFSYKLPLSEIESIEIPAQPTAHGFQLKLKGETNCEVRLNILKDNAVRYKFAFSGSIDTLIRKDWYENAISFKLGEEACNAEEVVVKFKLLTI